MKVARRGVPHSRCELAARIVELVDTQDQIRSRGSGQYPAVTPDLCSC